MRSIVATVAGIALTACSHVPVPHFSRQPVVGIVEYDTGLTRFSTVTGTYHQDMCSKATADVQVHLSDGEMKSIFAQADRSGFYKVKPDLTTDWNGTSGKPTHCAAFRLRVESGTLRNEVRWDCGADGSNAPPAQLAPMVAMVQKALRSKKQVQSMPWSSCQVR